MRAESQTDTKHDRPHEHDRGDEYQHDGRCGLLDVLLATHHRARCAKERRVEREAENEQQEERDANERVHAWECAFRRRCPEQMEGRRPYQEDDERHREPRHHLCHGHGARAKNLSREQDIRLDARDHQLRDAVRLLLRHAAQDALPVDGDHRVENQRDSVAKKHARHGAGVFLATIGDLFGYRVQLEAGQRRDSAWVNAFAFEPHAQQTLAHQPSMTRMSTSEVALRPAYRNVWPLRVLSSSSMYPSASRSMIAAVARLSSPTRRFGLMARTRGAAASGVADLSAFATRAPRSVPVASRIRMLDKSGDGAAAPHLQWSTANPAASAT